MRLPLPCLFWALLGGLLTLPSAAPVRAAEPRTKKVLLIGIDGLRPDAIKAAKPPFLSALIKDGAYTDTTQILGTRYRRSDTLSGPGWSSILTGAWADKHGVQDNKFRSANFKVYPDFLQRLKQARPAAQTAVFVSWAPIAEQIMPSADVLKVFHPKDRSRDETLAGYVEADGLLAEEAARDLGAENPDAMFVCLGMVDAAGHAKGFHPSVKEYRQAIEFADGLVGMVLRAMVQRKTFAQEDWLVLVTSDHGGRGTKHEKGHDDADVLTVFLILSGPAVARGKLDGETYIVDAAATALAHLGVESKEEWKLDGKAVGLKRK